MLHLGCSPHAASSIKHGITVVLVREAPGGQRPRFVPEPYNLGPWGPCAPTTCCASGGFSPGSFCPTYGHCGRAGSVQVSVGPLAPWEQYRRMLLSPWSEPVPWDWGQGAHRALPPPACLEGLTFPVSGGQVMLCLSCQAVTSTSFVIRKGLRIFPFASFFGGGGGELRC